MTGLPRPTVPIVAAPMAGGPSTPALVAAVNDAGGLGFLAGGYLSADALGKQIDDVRTRSERPFGVNLFLPPLRETAPSAQVVAVYGEELRGDATALGVSLGEPRHDDDAVDSKIDALVAARPAVISLTFALPDASRLERLRASGAALVATVTSLDEARHAAALGFDGLCAQGTEAGGHRGVHVDDPDASPDAGAVPVLELLDAVVAADLGLPLWAAGGIVDAPGVATVLARGAEAAQLGTAFLRCPEAGTSATHRAALADPAREHTVVTRAFTGRPARALANRFTAEHSGVAAYPDVHHLTRPLRAAAAKAGDAERLHLWAGTGWRAAVEEPAASVLARCTP